MGRITLFDKRFANRENGAIEFPNKRWSVASITSAYEDWQLYR